MATIKEVAKRAGVSTATVSAVINESAYVSPELRRRVQQAVAELNYAPSNIARGLKRGRSQLIGLVVSDLSNPFFGRIVYAAEAAADEWGYSLVIFNSDEKPEVEKRLLERVRRLSCDGLILVPSAAPEHYQRNGLLQGQIPTVLLGRTVSGLACDSVALDNVAAGYRAASYLLDLGHTCIGSITGPQHISTGAGRLEGLRRAMNARGLSLDETLVQSGEFRKDMAYSVAKSLLTSPQRPTALYVANGVMALGVMRALIDLNLSCPKDISLASTDTIPGIEGLRPILTRTEHPITEMTNEAFRILVDKIEGRGQTEPRQVVFQPNLIVGDSCVPATSSTPI